jgi:hypothetical protein
MRPSNGYYPCQKKWTESLDTTGMPQLQIDILVKKLRLHVMELHDIYVKCKDFELSQRILDEVYVIENMLRSLETLL